MNKFYILSEIGGWGVWPSEVQYFLQQNRGKDVEVFINSPGGYIDDGTAIYNLFRNHDGLVTMRVIGLAASMASVILMAGDVRIIETGATVMIHKPSVGMIGDADQLRKGADYLDLLQKTTLDIYVERSGSAREILEPLVNAETWMDAKQALELGIVTEEIQSFSAVACAVRHDLTRFTNTPEALKRGAKAITPEKPAEVPVAPIQQPTAEEPAMELSKATLADVEKENPSLISAIAKAATEKEQGRVLALEGLAKHAEGAPKEVQAAVAAEISKLRLNPEATAENSAVTLLGVMAKAQTKVANGIGAGARQLGKDTEEIPAGEDAPTGEEDEKAEAKNRVSGMAAGFKNKRI